jgi:hypothetical protein
MINGGFCHDSSVALCLTLYFGKITVVNWFWFVYAFKLVEIGVSMRLRLAVSSNNRQP